MPCCHLVFAVEEEKVPAPLHGLFINSPRDLKNAFFLTHRSRIAVDLFRADGTGARFEGGALDTAEATVRFVDEQGDIGAGVVAEELGAGVADADLDGIRE